jgi:hypothetical protein
MFHWTAIPGELRWRRKHSAAALPRSTHLISLVALRLWAACLLALVAQAPSLFAAESPDPPTAGGSAETGPNQVSTPPTLPAARNPVDFFRELLALSPVEQRQQLASRFLPEIQKLLLAKIREYESLTPNQRELRLRSTELRWYLFPLMQMTATNRLHHLSLVPEELRASVESRLAAWDQVPPALQKELLEHETAIRLEAESRAGGEQPPVPIRPESRQQLEIALARWRSMPAEDREKLVQRFERFFTLNAQEQAAALESVSEPERQQIQQTLKTFARLTPVQRRESLHALYKYANLTAEERSQFLRDAERWKLMDPDQRQAWRDLVAKLGAQPPLPSSALPGPPPLP